MEHRHPANQAVFDGRSNTERAVDGFITYSGNGLTASVVIGVAIGLAAVARRGEPDRSGRPYLTPGESPESGSSGGSLSSRKARLLLSASP
jgi:hypothetical protein